MLFTALLISFLCFFSQKKTSNCILYRPTPCLSFKVNRISCQVPGKRTAWDHIHLLLEFQEQKGSYFCLYVGDRKSNIKPNLSIENNF
jgi:uncharacterized Zn-finger protein